MRDDAVTVAAIAIVAMCAATVAHEAIGHGGACLLLHGRITLLTNVYFHCSAASPYVSPAGPLGNLAAGLAGWAALRLLPASRSRMKLFALLLIAFSFFWAFGYLISSLATNNGDYAIAGRDFFGQAYERWRDAGVVAGAVLYVLFSRVFAAQAGRSLGGRATPLLRIAWLAASIGAIATAALYAPDRGGAMLQAALEIGAASIPLLIPRRQAQGAGETGQIKRSKAWLAAAAITFAVFAATLGVGYAS